MISLAVTAVLLCAAATRADGICWGGTVGGLTIWVAELVHSDRLRGRVRTLPSAN